MYSTFEKYTYTGAVKTTKKVQKNCEFFFLVEMPIVVQLFFGMSVPLKNLYVNLFAWLLTHQQMF